MKGGSGDWRNNEGKVFITRITGQTTSCIACAGSSEEVLGQALASLQMCMIPGTYLVLLSLLADLELAFPCIA